MKSFIEVRDEYKTGKMFSVGDSVKTKDGIVAEVVNLGTNYLTLIHEGEIFKEWITDVKLCKKVSVKEEDGKFSFKGYKTKNLSESDVSEFKNLIESSTDLYAILNCIQSVDLLVGSEKKLVENNFDTYRMSYDRAIKYLKKFNINPSIISEAETILLEVGIEKGLKFSANDKSKVAMIIATSAGVDTNGDPVTVVNRAAQHFKSSRLTPEGWSILGKMLNKASEAGIKWNKDIFAPTTKKFMELA